MATPNSDFKYVEDSQVTITELMIPAYANFGGKIHGGSVLSLIDKVAYAAAARHAGSYCVTLSVDRVLFLHPIEVGQLVSLKASVNYVGNTSLIVGVRVTSEDVKTGKVWHTNSCYLTMVALDDRGNKLQVPGLKLRTQEEVRRWYEAWQRRQHAMAVRQEEATRETVDVEQARKIAATQRCQIELS
ncbi:MAG: acyl-CoA thioesterase [Bacteroidota bacterium]